MDKRQKEFQGLANRGVFKKTATAEFDFYQVVPGNTVTVWHPRANEKVKITGFTGNKARNKNHRNTIQYERGPMGKGYIPMYEVWSPSVEKRAVGNTARKRKVTTLAQRPMF